MDNEMIERCTNVMLKKMSEMGLIITTINKLPVKNYNYVIIEIIKAMREPTEKMSIAAEEGDCLEEGSSAYGCWQTMIDVIIKND